MNGSVSITWNKDTRVLEGTLESRSIVSDRPMHPSQLGDRSSEGPGRGFIRGVEDQEAFITSHSGGGCVHPSQISHLICAAVLCSAFARSLAADVSIEGTRAGEKNRTSHISWLEPEARRAIWLSGPKGKHGAG